MRLDVGCAGVSVPSVPLDEGDGASEARAGGRAGRNVAVGVSESSTNGELDPPRALRAALSPSWRGTLPFPPPLPKANQ
jgi:hypothetical protein